MALREGGIRIQDWFIEQAITLIVIIVGLGSIVLGVAYSWFKKNSRDYSLIGESLFELKRLRAAIPESIEKLENILQINPNPFILIPSVVQPLTFQNPLKTKVFKKRNGYLTFLWEALETMRVSVMLCLGFRYASALSLLRLSLETFIRAAFFDTIAQKKYRLDTSVKDLKIEHFVKNLLSDILEKNPDLEKKFEESSSLLFQELQEYMIGQKDWWKLPKFTHMIEALESWSFLSPVDNKEVQDLYGWLSKPVHMTPQFMDVIIQITKLDNAFGEPKLVEDFTELYVFLLCDVLDVALVLSFNILQQEHDEDYVREVARDISSDSTITDEKLPFFKQLIDGYN